MARSNRPFRTSPAAPRLGLQPYGDVIYAQVRCPHRGMGFDSDVRFLETAKSVWFAFLIPQIWKSGPYGTVIFTNGLSFYVMKPGGGFYGIGDLQSHGGTMPKERRLEVNRGEVQEAIETFTATLS